VFDSIQGFRYQIAAINIEHRYEDSELRACKDRKAVKALLMSRHLAWKQHHGWP